MARFFLFLCTFWGYILFALDNQVEASLVELKKISDNESKLKLFPENFSTNPENFTDFESFLV